jgi:hypothetical protein
MQSEICEYKGLSTQVGVPQNDEATKLYTTE